MKTDKPDGGGFMIGWGCQDFKPQSTQNKIRGRRGYWYLGKDFLYKKNAKGGDWRMVGGYR